MPWDVFDALNNRGESALVVWIAKKKLTRREIGQLNQKIDMLIQNGPDLSPGLLAGPVKSKRNKKLVSHIYKLIIHSDRMLRPMLCKGPIDLQNEFTMLLGAIEAGGVLDTDTADADDVRLAIIANKQLRKPHERYS